MLTYSNIFRYWMEASRLLGHYSNFVLFFCFCFFFNSLLDNLNIILSSVHYPRIRLISIAIVLMRCLNIALPFTSIIFLWKLLDRMLALMEFYRSFWAATLIRTVITIHESIYVSLASIVPWWITKTTTTNETRLE